MTVLIRQHKRREFVPFSEGHRVSRAAAAAAAAVTASLLETDKAAAVVVVGQVTSAGVAAEAR